MNNVLNPICLLKSFSLVIYLFMTSSFVFADEHLDHLKQLPLGDGKISNSPRQGYIWSCQNQFRGGGAQTQGNWINGDGTYDFNKKPVVDGEVEWPAQFDINLDNDERKITSNDFPSHLTGTFPIQRIDDAFQYDRNPNSIRSQSLQLILPIDPQIAKQASCLGMGPIGILLSGSVFFNALDARGVDAVAHEIQDACQGHPERSGSYHYHSVTTCQDDNNDSSHSALMGYAVDGFGIYGHRDEGGKLLRNEDLDECHGHIHTIIWDKKPKDMYHYHATWEFPYTLSCFKGTPGKFLSKQAGRLSENETSQLDTTTGNSSDKLGILILGSGTPRYSEQRSRPSALISFGDEKILVDMGLGTDQRLNEEGIQLNQISTMMLTHHHIDHNAELPALLVTSRVRSGVDNIYGPPGTKRYVDFLLDFYTEDMLYRSRQSGRTLEEIQGLNVQDLNGGESFQVGDIVVHTTQVNHTIHTIAYRFDTRQQSIVISGDLSYSESLVTLANNADILVIDSGGMPSLSKNGQRRVSTERQGRRQNSNRPERTGNRLNARQGGGSNVEVRAHASLEDVAKMAQKANVGMLVLSHIGVDDVDEESVFNRISKIYNGEIRIASDGDSYSPK